MKYSYLVVLVMAIFFSACTRPVVDKSSSMTIALPKEMKLKAAYSTQAVSAFLGHVVINVRGPGIAAPISVNFDADKHSGAQPTSLPGSFTIDVPPGTGRLIQIMAIYVDTTTMVGDFYYGDVTQDLVSGDNNIMIPVNLVGSGGIQGGGISGRYYLADGSTPSGTIESRYQPPSGKPAVVIERNSMLNGWFASFALDTIPMDVVLVPNEVKMFTALKLSNFDSSTMTDNKKMKVLLPDRYQSYSGGSGGDNKRGETSVIGFFGDGVPAAAKVCFTEASRTYSQLFTDSTKTVPLQWSASSTNLVDIRAVKSSSVVACTTNDLTAAYTSVIPFTPSLLNNWGGSEAVPGFMGVFRFPSNTSMGSSPVQVSYNILGQYIAQFSVLPGTPDIADSVGVFYRASSSPQDYYGSGGSAPCQQLAQGGFGFSKISSIPLAAGTLDYNVTNASPADINSNAVMAFCPMKNGSPIGGGYVASHFSSNSQTLANSFSARTEFSTVGQNQCHRIRLNLSDSTTNSTNVMNTSIRNFSVTTTLPNLTFYNTEASCVAGTPTTSSAAISAGSTYAEVWYKDINAESGNISVSSTSFGGTTVAQTINLTSTSPTTVAALKVSSTDIRMPSDNCWVVDVYTVDSIGVPAPVTSATMASVSKLDLNLSVVADSTFNFYTDCTGTTSMTALNFAATEFRKRFAIKSGSVTPSSDRIIQFYATGLSTFNIYLNMLNYCVLANPPIGSICADGTIYAGLTPDGNVKMYTTPCDAGMTGTRNSCSGTRITKTWNNGSSNWTTTGASSATSGATNTATLITLVDAGATYNAAAYCASLNVGGTTGWYLPSHLEMGVLNSNQAAIGGFMNGSAGNYYWTSVENSSSVANCWDFFAGGYYGGSKASPYNIRCVRK